MTGNLHLHRGTLRGMFGERLRQAREQNGLTQTEFADAVGASQQTVSRWEKGETFPEVGRMTTVAKVLGIDVTVLTAIRIETQAQQLREAVSAPLRAVRATAGAKEDGDGNRAGNGDGNKAVEDRLAVIEDRVAGIEHTMATLLDRLGILAGLSTQEPAPDGRRSRSAT